MLRVALAPLAPVAVPASPAAPVFAVESCDLNGEHVNPNNGNTTAGKTGLMRCRDGDGGRLLREQELKGGVFVGVVRDYGRDGALEREYSVNERGNRDGLWRECERGELVSEQHWFLNGQPRDRTDYASVDGKLRAEIVYDERGRPTDERELDASGKVVRDDEFSEDGSRKAFGT